MTSRIRPKLTEQVMLCRACDTYFRGLSNFDAHRRTAHGPAPHPNDGPPRICAPPNLVGLVYRDDKGWWASKPMTDEQKRAAGWLDDEKTPPEQMPYEFPGP